MRFDMRLMSNGAAILRGNLIADRRHEHEPKAGEDDRMGNLPVQAKDPRSRGQLGLVSELYQSSQGMFCPTTSKWAFSQGIPPCVNLPST
ncbi:MAG: hypothetical protein RIR52_1328 [Acidobacteriota bacterium]